MKEQSLADVYLAALGPGSRRAMTQALETIAKLAGSDKSEDIDAFD